jgi:hypothetical protein
MVSIFTEEKSGILKKQWKFLLSYDIFAALKNTWMYSVIFLMLRMSPSKYGSNPQLEITCYSNLPAKELNVSPAF